MSTTGLPWWKIKLRQVRARELLSDRIQSQTKVFGFDTNDLHTKLPPNTLSDAQLAMMQKYNCYIYVKGKRMRYLREL